MTYVAADGPPEVDAKHAWTPASGPTPPVINDWSADPITFPFIELQGITGWRAGAEADDIREPNIGRNGETAWPGYTRGKTVVYDMEVQASSREALRAKVTALLNGYGDRSGLGTMVVTPFSSIGGVAWRFKARVVDLDVDPVFTYQPARTGPWRTGAELSLRMVDARFYLNTAVSVTTVADGVTQGVTNAGLVASDPVFTITTTDTTNPAEIILANTQLTDGIMRFDMPALTTLLVVDFANRTARATINGVANTDALPYFNVGESRWWDDGVPGLQVGANDLTVDGGSWTMTYYPAYW